MIEQAQGWIRKCGGILILFALMACFLAGRTIAAPAPPESGAAPTAQTPDAPPQNPPAAPAADTTPGMQAPAPAAQAPAPAAKSKQAAAQYGDIYIRYERMSQDGNRIMADGNVEVHYRNIVIFADHMEVDSKTKDVLAVGKVTLHIGEEPKKPKAGPGPAAKPAAIPAAPAAAVNEDGTLAPPPPPAPAHEVFSTERLEFNLDTAQGKMEKAFGMIEPSFRYQADSLEREGDIYKMDKMSFTACAQPNPRWGFSCARANLKKDDYIDMWGVTLRIKSVPILYWPYMRYPLNRDRSTGFLTPKFGYTGTKGFYLTENFYWDIARNMDFTAEASYYSKKGVGTGAEFRYMFDKSFGGSLNVIYFRFNEAAQAIGGTAADAYIVRWNHNQPLPGGFSLTAAVDYQSSFDFLREFDVNFQQAMVANRSSQIYVTKSWSILSLSVRASQFETYFPAYGAQGDSIISRYLPRISLNSYKIKLFGPLYLSFGGEFYNWIYGWKSDYDKGTEGRYQTASFSPVLSLPWSALPWLGVNVSLSGDFSYYWQTYKTDATGTTKITNDPLGVARYSIGLDLLGPRFYKIFELKNSRIKHLIEPVVSYRYDLPYANSARFPTSSGYFQYHQLTYGLTNHLYLKERGAGPGTSAREILTFGLSQTFYIAPETGPLSYYRVNGLPPPFSEVTSYLRFYPGRLINVDFSASYNPYYKTFSSLRLGAGIGQPKDDFFLTVNWYKSINAWLSGAAEAAQNGLPLEYSSIWDRHQISIVGGLKIPALDLEGKGEFDYNIIEKKILYVMGDLTFHYQCFDLKADVRLFYFRDVPEIRVGFTVGIGNIGHSSSMLEGSNY
jgi:lipopolysaccharide assembly outer membrane protein LptD (OstA)